MRANQLRLWLSSLAYVLICALRRIGLAGTKFAEATGGAIRMKLFKVGALVKINARRVRFGMASGYPYVEDWRRVATAWRALAARPLKGVAAAPKIRRSTQ